MQLSEYRASSTLIESINIDEKRTVIVKVPLLGLANRLRVLLSAVLLASKWQGELVVDWRASNGLNASLGQLFPGAFSEYSGSRQALDAVGATVNSSARLAIVRSSMPSIVVLKTKGIRLQDQDVYTLERTESKVLVLIAEGQFALASVSCLEYFESKRRLYQELFERSSVQQEFKTVLAFFGSSRLLFGVHARVFDEVHDWRVVAPQKKNETQALQWDEIASLDLHVDAVRQALRRHPNALVFVASNSAHAKAFILNRLPKTHALGIRHAHLERNSLEGVKAALLDFMLLAQSSLLLHTFGSSFGEEAAVLRPALASIRIRDQGHILGADLNRPYCNHPLFENTDSSAVHSSSDDSHDAAAEMTKNKTWCYHDQEEITVPQDDTRTTRQNDTTRRPSLQGRQVCTRPLVRSYCDPVIETWGVQNVYC